MADLKYFARIEALIRDDAASAGRPLPPFDFESLGGGAKRGGIGRFLLRRVLPAVTFVLRQVWPNPRFGRLVLVTRTQDVEQVLRDDAGFKVVYGPEMRDLGGGCDNVLSIDDPGHAILREDLRAAVRPGDPQALFDNVLRDATALLDAGGGRIDVMRDLISRTATEALCRYFGLTVHDPDTFGQWTMAVSLQLFGDFFGDANVHRQARTASIHLASVIDDAIARVNLNNAAHPCGQRVQATLIDRMITGQKIPPHQVRATIIGLVTAFVPTNTLAAGNILEVLRDKPALMARVRDAAREGDRDAMRAALLEAGRLNPALSPGLWRHVPKTDAVPPVIGQGWRARRTRPGDLVLACIPSALRDRRGLTGRDWPLRRLWMMFGDGPHVCWGAELALTHLEAVFIALFRRESLRPAPGKLGAMARNGPYPTRMDMLYDAPNAKRAMAIVALPVRPGADRALVERDIDALGNPARPHIADTLSKGDRVQFASLSVIERAPGSPDSILLLELSGDGDEMALLDHVARQGFGWLARIVSWCEPAGRPILTEEALAQRLRAGFFPLRQRPWGPTGLHFDGLPELSVTDIAQQARVADFARKVVARHLKGNLGLNTRAMAVLLRTRRLIRGDSFLGLRKVNLAAQKAADRQRLRETVLRPGRQRMAMADWEPKGLLAGVAATLIAPENRFLAYGAGALFVFWSVVRLFWRSTPPGTPWAWIVALVPAIAGALPAMLLTIVAAFTLLATLLYWQELHDPVDTRAASLEHLKAISGREDAPGRAQNHIIAVMPFKPGWLRRLSFAFALWGIRQSVTHFFRPGFVVMMGTIHKARWFRVPGSDQFVFCSNYDGSWESYLEDFITRAHQGQSAAWSHGVGFPPTRLLINRGAADGDAFKRWVRLQQRETRFWYSRFPHLTAQQIRNNAMIVDGLARATSDTDARRWLASFGSSQREADELETQEAQTIVFSGLGSMTEATSLMLRLPADREHVAAWLGAISGLNPSPIMNIAYPPPPHWVRPPPKGSRVIRLPEEARVLFGDRSASVGGAVIGLTAEGLERAGLDEPGGLETMPSAFRMTMAARSALLGDAPGAAAAWRFTDAAGDPREVHAMLTVYGHEVGRTHAQLADDHQQLLAHFHGAVVHAIPCAPVAGPDGDPPRLDVEPFGFKDGVSQPVIRGTRRAAQAVPDRDLVAPGEFLLGYRNHQGHFPPSITVGAELDPACDLPTVSATRTNRFPFFGQREGEAEARDFGRNGVFVAVRQLDQDVAGFWDQAERVSHALRRSYPDLAELAGGKVSKAWVAAKIIGRWPDGSPLVGHQDGPASAPKPDNDFTYGVDDPRGLACPLGAHIRRANPRDSQEPGDPDEQRITNRHRILRRGRAYDYAADGPQSRKTGLLFMALCADFERQFEFVQRTWINATAFHGLVNERDPLLSQNAADRGAVFTIPTAAGPIAVRGLNAYVEPRGGAYFFLPSRSALAHLITRGRR
jgi:cytochrome P450/deferrochelatase/peroxidase EfeB